MDTSHYIYIYIYIYVCIHFFRGCCAAYKWLCLKRPMELQGKTNIIIHKNYKRTKYLQSQEFNKLCYGPQKTEALAYIFRSLNY